MKQGSHNRPPILRFRFYEMSRRSKTIEIEGTLVVGQGNMEWLLMGPNFPSWGYQNVLKVPVVMGTQPEYTKHH